MSSDPTAAAAWAHDALAAAGDPVKAPQMQAYMKSSMPYHGVQKPVRVPIARQLCKQFAPSDHDNWEAVVLALWGSSHREGRYLAIDYAARFKAYHTPDVLPLAQRLIREGAWWDLVDDVTGRLVDPVYRAHREVVGPVMDTWIEHDDLWVRRAAIISQLRHKGDTDTERLFRYCLSQAHEREFFLRKAIGWALRQLAWTDPDTVIAFLLAHPDRFSGLSIREATKNLKKKGLWPVA